MVKEKKIDKVDVKEKASKLPYPARAMDVSKNFAVSGMPLTTWIKFKRFAVEHAGDSYWMAIDKLLTMQEMDYKYALLFNELTELKGFVQNLAVESVKAEEPEETEEVEEEVITMGSKGIKERKRKGGK